MSHISKSGSKTTLNERRSIKEIRKSQGSSEELGQYEENINLNHMRSISPPLNKDEKKKKIFMTLRKSL